MVQPVDKLEISKIEQLLEEEFGQLVSSDPFLCYLKYEDTLLKGILSYSHIYDRIEINYIWVDVQYRKRGIAFALLSYLDVLAHNTKVKNISLEVECENVPAIHLYYKCGYQKVAKREKYYYGKDAYLMVKEVIK